MANDASLDQQDLEDAYYDLYSLIIEKFPECSCDDETKGGSEYTSISYVKRPLEQGLGWTQINWENLKVERVLISDKALSTEPIILDSIIAHEAAHVAAFNFLISQENPDKESWDKCGGHTEKWHEIINWMNRLKSKSTGEKSFDIVEKVDDEVIKRYFGLI